MKDKQARIRHYIQWFDAITIGGLITSISFYWTYDQWRPLVWVASITAVIKIGQHFVALMVDLEA